MSEVARSFRRMLWISYRTQMLWDVWSLGVLRFTILSSLLTKQTSQRERLVMEFMSGNQKHEPHSP